VNLRIEWNTVPDFTLCDHSRHSSDGVLFYNLKRRQHPSSGRSAYEVSLVTSHTNYPTSLVDHAPYLFSELLFAYTGDAGRSIGDPLGREGGAWRKVDLDMVLRSCREMRHASKNMCTCTCVGCSAPPTSCTLSRFQQPSIRVRWVRERKYPMVSPYPD
jgi:hypothetical protein